MNKVIKNSSYLFLLYLLLIPSLTFSQGSRYTGSYKKSSPIEYVNKTNIVIEGLEFSPSSQYAIVLWNCKNVVIKNCKFTSAPNIRAVYIEKGDNVTITDCTFENVYEGVLVERSNNNIKVEHNDFKNIRGQLDGGAYFATAVQFNRVSGSGNSISYNAIENIQGQSSPEDIINLFASNGTPNSPIMVKENWLRGGGPNLSGGGINLGDHGGSYQIAEKNILVNPGQYGIAISGGHDMILRDNKVYGKRQSFTNVGLIATNWTPNVGSAYNITVERNQINWTNKDGNINTLWSPAKKGEITGWESNRHDASLNESILPKEILNRAGKTDNSPDENEPEIDQPTVPESPIAQVYIDKFNRVAVKYLVSPIPVAHAEGFTSSGELLVEMPLPRYNQAFSVTVPKGDYYIKITYPNLGKTEITKITL